MDHKESEIQFYTLVNIFTPTTGKLDALLELQLAEMKAMSTAARKAGWRGNEVYKAKDGTRLIVVTRFRSEADKETWAQTAMFQDHIARIGPLVETG